LISTAAKLPSHSPAAISKDERLKMRIHKEQELIERVARFSIETLLWFER
jgi:hypothetical protein